MEKTSEAGKAGSFCRKEKGVGTEFICSVDGWMSGKLTVHTQKRQTHPMAYSEVYLSHSLHCPRSPKATLFLVLLVVTFYGPTKAHRHCFLVCQCKTLSADLWGHKSRFCSFRLLHFPSSLISLFHYFPLWFNLPSVCNYSRPPECSPSEMKSLALTSSWHAFSLFHFSTFVIYL